MGNAELDRINALLGDVHSPEAVFGTLVGKEAEQLVAAKKIFLHLAKTIHPDLYHDTSDYCKADLTFKMLIHLWQQAQTKIENGTYGDVESSAAFKPFVICTPTCRYTAERPLTSGDMCNLYIATATLRGKEMKVLLKITSKPEDNDLVTNEVRILRHLHGAPSYDKLRHFISQLVDAFPYEEHSTGIIRQITVLSYLEGFYSLKEIRDAYPHGIDVKDMAWIWRRVLVALSFAHTNQVIHGSILPTHILVHSEQHGVVLIDWSYAVLNPMRTHEYISAISTAYREWYPAEVFAREEPTPGLDIAMAATCMIDLLGGNPRQHMMPATVPWQIQQHLKGCILPYPQQRLQEASSLLKDFDELIERLWGPRAFHQFIMPKR